jgi:hypothetical protein
MADVRLTPVRPAPIESSITPSTIAVGELRDNQAARAAAAA